MVKNEIDATVFDYETAKALNDVALRLGKVASAISRLIPE